jgi:hypothetical protein
MFPAVRSNRERLIMCDYSLHHVASRPARVGDQLISTRFRNSLTRGFAEVGCPDVAVCLRPGTELAFESDVKRYALFPFMRHRRLKQKVARFRQINVDKPDTHHDALEFPDGKIVRVTELCEGQRATVLQLPASVQTQTVAEPAHAKSDDRVIRQSRRDLRLV